MFENSGRVYVCTCIDRSVRDPSDGYVAITRNDVVPIRNFSVAADPVPSTFQSGLPGF